MLDFISKNGLYSAFIWMLGCNILFVPFAIAQDNRPTIASPWSKYLSDQVAYIEEATNRELQEISRDNWQETQAAWRDELQEMLGLKPWPERTSLEPKITSTLEGNGYRVENLHFQPSPKLYVGANFYLPTGTKPSAGWPAVLYVCGHAKVDEFGRLAGNKTSYQHHGIWFARHGIACLIIDTIQLGEFQGEHHGTYKLGRWDWISKGYTPAGVEAWSSIRAVDYLLSRTEIDAQRIGITGRSGGGAYSWYAAALDPRIKVAVPVAGITDLRNHVLDGCVEGHCDCMYMVNTFRWDYGKLAALIAPRPLLLTNTDSDSIFPLDGVIRIHRQLESLYRRIGKPQDYGVLIGPGPHKDSQELQVGAFKWLHLHLTGKEIVVDRAAVKELESRQLVAFAKELPLDEKVTGASRDFASKRSSTREAWNKEGREWLERVEALESHEKRNAAFEQANENRQGNEGKWNWILYQTKSEASWEAQWIRVSPIDPRAIKNNLLHLGLATVPKRPESESAEDWIRRILTSGAVARELELAPQSEHWIALPRGWDMEASVASVKARTQFHRRLYLLGDSLEQLQFRDICALWDWIQRSPKSNTTDGINREWTLKGHGRAGLLATLLAWRNQWRVESLGPSGGTQPKISSIEIQAPNEDWRLQSVLPGFASKWDAGQVVDWLRDRMDVRESSSSLEGGAQELVDSSNEPQQATGMKIVEVTDSSAVVWARATRWPLPNLGDLDSVQFSNETKSGQQQSGAKLPVDGIAGLRHAVPGVSAEIRVRYKRTDRGDWHESAWQKVDPSTDYSVLVPLDGLDANRSYEVRTDARSASDGPMSTLIGRFKTLPDTKEKASLRIGIATCQEFEDRDGPFGFEAYRTMLKRRTDCFVMAGDVVYYDKLARSVPLAFYHWQRTYGLPSVVEFHRNVPVYFLKDDHDTYIDDSWPGKRVKWTDEFTFEDGQRIFRTQTGLPEKPYRTIRMGRDLQVWMLEGRDYRSPNPAPDGEGKSILGSEQKRWLLNSLAESSAKFRIVVSPTPIVGPDRDSKKDNHSNLVFANEGKELRKALSEIPGCFVICGDRHWQYHSIDPATGLHEFSVGPISNRHAGGWKQDDFRADTHQFLRVAGGYLELEMTYKGDSPTLLVRHLDPFGATVHEVAR